MMISESDNNQLIFEGISDRKAGNRFRRSSYPLENHRSLVGDKTLIRLFCVHRPTRRTHSTTIPKPIYQVTILTESLFESRSEAPGQFRLCLRNRFLHDKVLLLIRPAFSRLKTGHSVRLQKCNELAKDIQSSMQG